MLKRTLYFGNPAYLSLHNSLLRISYPAGDDRPPRTVPIEDVAYVVLDCQQLTITQALLGKLLENEVAVITCNERHMPAGLHLPLAGHTLQSERFKQQLGASLPLRKQLWRQTVQTKILNQAAVLRSLGIENGNMLAWARQVRSGDTSNLEGRAAVYYWKNVFPLSGKFVRDRFGDYPNSHLNYGYAILRAVIARSLVSSGLLPTLGIHHSNRYNAYCLADDVMEPYRPYVDKLVVEMCAETGEGEELVLDTEAKRRLLSIPVLDVDIDGHRSPLMIAASVTSASLHKCYAGESRSIVYPLMNAD